MTKESAIKLIWNYAHLNHELKKADIILTLGSTDLSTADRAVELWFSGFAPLMVFSGSGTVHAGESIWDKFKGSTEAEVFADTAIKAGVPKECILIENKSQNTGQNFEFTIKLLRENNIYVKTVIAVQKPYMERRVYATGKVWWPDVELSVTSPETTIEEYEKFHTQIGEDSERRIHGMVADLQRIKEYPKKGFQIEQEIPAPV